jgi:hypothetical protein
MRAFAVAATLVSTISGGSAVAEDPNKWPVHDLTRPAPPVIDPGTASTPDQPGRPPSDAIVLFDGKDLSKWVSSKSKGPAPWKVANGSFEVVKGTGAIETRDSYGDCQLHIEWAAPSPAVGDGQDRGNSGVFFGGSRYEVQVLDSYRSATYPDGQASALYGQYPPLVNATRPPGDWQTYDIVYMGPRFDPDGKVTRAARITVFLNGVLVQNASELTGATAHKARPPYQAHPEKLPLSLQDHSHPVRFRNVWLRELPSP